jgi:hypothetical protein
LQELQNILNSRVESKGVTNRHSVTPELLQLLNSFFLSFLVLKLVRQDT